MRMTTIIAALRSLVNSLWPFARTPASPTGPATSHPMSEPLPATPDEAVLDPDQSQAGDTPREASDERDGPSDEQPEGGPLDDEPRPTESSTASAGPPSDPALPEHEPPLSSSDTDDQLLPDSAEVEPDESPTTTPPTDDDGQHAPPETGEETESGESDGVAVANTGATDSRKPKRRPRQFGGRRGQQAGNPGPERQHSPSFRPELVCRKIPASACWEVILTADEECQLAAAHFEGAPLDFTDGQCRISLLNGRLTVSFQDGQELVVPLFEGGPLIFKLRKNWAGEGRRTSGITSGHFIVIAPNSWRRMGHAPVEADGCADPAFRAHYFHRDATTSDEGVDGFREWNDSSVTAGIELTGRRIHDDSDEGELFVGDPPDLKSSPDIEWARVGEEATNGWGKNFQPHRQSLSEALDGRQGRIFLRVYDSDVSMLDSVAFRHLPNLRQIHVNGDEYSQDTVLVPRSTGYPPTAVRFVGAGGSTLWPVLPVGARQKALPSGAIEVPPCPDADRITCSLGSDARGVNIVLDLPRMWWRLEDGRADPGAWRDTPLVMTREEFRRHAHSNATISLLSKRQASVRAGFDDELDQPYRRTIDDDRIAVPLVHFVDHAQIDRRLNDDACFNVEWAQEIVPLVVISADPMPEIVSFTAEPATVVHGEETILEWMTRNADDSRVAINPDAGVVETDGTYTVRPAETTKYTLTLSVLGTDDISRTATVTVVSPSTTSDERPTPRVMSTGGGWRTGKGFTSSELQDAGLTVKEAADRSIPIDRRRRTSHRANVETIRSMLDA